MKRNESGQGLVVYALILVLVAIVAIAILAILGPQIGKVFSQTTYVLGNPPTGYYSNIVVDQADQFKRGRYWTEGPGGVEFTLEKFEVFREGGLEEEEALQELAPLMEETMLETLESPLEFAEESGDTALFDRLAAIESATLSGDYEAVLALLTEPLGASVSIPEAVWLKAMAKYTPRVIKACQVIDGKQVPYQDYVEAREEILLLGVPEAAIVLDGAWDIIEPRNEFIVDVQPALIQSAEAGIAFLLDSGQTSYVVLAEQLQDELATCSGS